jgi:hypothetical protein
VKLTTGNPRDALIQAYYLGTPLFWLLDVALQAPIRAAALPDPGWRLLYYAFAMGCGILARWRPRLTPFIGLAESSVSLLLLVLSVLLPIFTLPSRVAEGGDLAVPFGPTQLINVFLSGSMLVISFYRNQERISALIRGASDDRIE